MGEGPSELIMLTTGLIVAALVSSVLLTTWDSMSQGLENQGDQAIKDAKTRASLVNDPSSITWSNVDDQANIFLQNSGKISLNIDQTYIVLNGEIMTLTPIGTEGITWSTGVVVQFQINAATDITLSDDTPYFLNIGVSSLSVSPTGTYSFSEVVRLDIP